MSNCLMPTAFETLRELRPLLMEKYPLRSLALFGSEGRGEASAGSDVDVLVSFQPGAVVDLFDLGRLQAELETALGRQVDLVEREPLSDELQ